MNVLAFFFRAIWLAVRLVFHTLRWAFWLLGWIAPRLFRRARTTFGSARWAGLGQLIGGGAWNSHGLIVGKLWGRFLRFQGEGAVLVYAPQGSGKGVGVVIPNLLDHPGSVIVTDVKGENAAVTRRHRATLGPVYGINAIEPAASACFNPLSMIRLGSYHEAEDIAALADLLVTPESYEGHWDTSAKNVIALFINYVMHAMPRERRTLSTVRELIASDGEHLHELLDRMARMPSSTIAEEARQLLKGISAENEESLSVFNNAAKAMGILVKGSGLRAADRHDRLRHDGPASRGDHRLRDDPRGLLDHLRALPARDDGLCDHCTGTGKVPPPSGTPAAAIDRRVRRAPAPRRIGEGHRLSARLCADDPGLPGSGSAVRPLRSGVRLQLHGRERRPDRLSCQRQPHGS